MRLFREATGEQTGKVDESLPNLIEESDFEKLANFEVGLGERRNETLFKVTVEIENTEKVLKQAEQLILRLKKRLQQLKDLQRILSK